LVRRLKTLICAEGHPKGAEINKVDVESSQSERCRLSLQKQRRLATNDFPAGITPDGHWMVFVHRNYLASSTAATQ